MLKSCLQKQFGWQLASLYMTQRLAVISGRPAFTL